MSDSLRIGIRGSLVGIFLACLSGVATADVVSDQATAIVIWPDVVVLGGVDSADPCFADTVFQLSNTSQEPVLAHCFYENANYHCSNSGQVCIFPGECCDPSTGCGRCEPGWLETDFRIRLTPRQPIGWVAFEGLAGVDFPLTGAVGSTGPDGSSNAGSSIPPVAEVPYNGSLKCIAINDDGTPSDRNVLKGESTKMMQLPGGGYTVAKHNAIGIKAIEGAVNDDRELILGGGDAEYEGCPEVLIVNHLFDGVQNPALAGVAEAPAETNGFFFDGGPGTTASRLTLVPCTQDYLRQVPGNAVVQYLVYNEFEQRFSTSRGVDCKFERVLSTIDTNDPNRSIFSAGVGGTVVGQTRLRAIGSGLVGVLTEATFGRFGSAGLSGGLNQMRPKTLIGDPVFGLVYQAGGELSEVNIHQQGDRAEADVITLP